MATVPANRRHLWDLLKDVPPAAQKTIGGGRLKGMTDIKPQWRYERMTEVFGPCGLGWRYEIAKQWLEHCEATGEVAAMVNVNLYIFDQTSCEWSHAIPGTGGSMFIASEKHGPYCSDEAYKMAMTDALSVAMKMIGVASEVYMGHGVKDGGSKYEPRAANNSAPPPQRANSNPPCVIPITPETIAELQAIGAAAYKEQWDASIQGLCRYCSDGNAEDLQHLTMKDAERVKRYIETRGKSEA